MSLSIGIFSSDVNIFRAVRALARVLALSLSFWMSLTAMPDAQQSEERGTDWERQLELLQSVPYVSLSRSQVDTAQSGVVLIDSSRVYDGYNFYCTKSSGEALLLDMNGEVVHRWTYPPKHGGGSDYAILLENGDVVILKKLRELLRLNWNSEILWRKELMVHHDVVRSPGGSFYVLVQELKEYRGLKVLFESIVHLSAAGVKMDLWSAYDHLDELKGLLDSRSFLDTVLDSVQVTTGGEKEDGGRTAPRRSENRLYFDYFHTNTVSLLPDNALVERDSRFEEGNLLLCFRKVNQIVILEKDTYRILWAWGEGQLQWPHHPTMLPNGHILLFDNGVDRKYSRILEVEPLSGTVVWEYRADPPEDFYSFSRGSSQRLPNGNTLICESDNGRVFEVTPAGEMVWEWFNPTIQRGRREIVYRMLRHPKEMVERLLNEDGSE